MYTKESIFKPVQKQYEKIDKNLSLALLVLSLAVAGIAVYVNLVMGLKTVYTHFFYLPIMLAGIRFRKSVVYVGVFFGLLHVALGYVQSGTLTLDTFFRMLIMILFSTGIKYLTGIINAKHDEIIIERNMLGHLVRSIGDGVIAADMDKKVIMLNEAAETMTGWKSDEAEGKDVTQVFRLVHENEHYFIENPIDEVLRTRLGCELGEDAVLIHKNGDGIYIEDSASPIFNSKKELMGAVLVFRDVTQKKADRKRIQYLDHHDPLTGLYNRKFMRKELNRLDDDAYFPVSILVGDIDNLKYINDAYGYAAGDNAIVAIGDMIKRHVRDCDVVARNGGDTFAVVMPNSDFENAEVVASGIEKACSRMAEGEWNMSITFGWNVRASQVEDLNIFYKHAEDHMYKRKLNNLPSARGKSLQTSMRTLFVKSPREKMHSERVSRYCTEMAKILRMDVRAAEDLKTLSLLHDIGKIIISENVLEKDGKLTDEEWMEMKRHPMVGYRIVRDSFKDRDTALAVLNHHERWDGKGYPQGLIGEQINLDARIIAIADSYDAMVSERPYKKAMTEAEAVDEIIKNAGKQFDPELARLFVEKVLKKEWN